MPLVFLKAYYHVSIPLSRHGVHDGPLEDEQSLIDTITGLNDDPLTENAESVISD